MVIGSDNLNSQKTSGISNNLFDGANMEANFNTENSKQLEKKDLKDTTFNSNVSRHSRNSRNHLARQSY